MSDQLVMPNGRIVTATDVLQLQETNMKGWRLAQARAIELDTLRRQLAEAEERLAELSPMVAGRWKARADTAEAKLALAEQDARRWRWFRENGDSWHGPDAPGFCYFEIGIAPEQLDTAIDAAIAAGEGRND